ncbi:MAG: hypothetical protein V4587_14135 [Acidobacteriota bacterium]
MDHDKLGPGSIICAACFMCMDDQRGDLAALTGKDKPQRMRNYSHFVIGGRWLPLSKGSKAEMLSILLQQPEVAIIALSGQKHLIFRAQPGWWQIEEASRRPFPDDLARILASVQPLLDGGFSKAEIESGRYISRRIADFGIDQWSDLDSNLRGLRGSIEMQLAVFLAKTKERESDGDDAIEGDSKQPAMAPVEGDSGRIQASVCTPDMATVRGQHSQLGLYE